MQISKWPENLLSKKSIFLCVLSIHLEHLKFLFKVNFLFKKNYVGQNRTGLVFIIIMVKEIQRILWYKLYLRELKLEILFQVCIFFKILHIPYTCCSACLVNCFSSECLQTFHYVKSWMLSKPCRWIARNLWYESQSSFWFVARIWVDHKIIEAPHRSDEEAGFSSL